MHLSIEMGIKIFCETYLISVFAFSIELEVLANLSSEFVHVWSAWGEVIVEI